MEKVEKVTSCLECKFQSSIFRFLTEEELNFINNVRFEVSFKAGENIFKQGGPLTHIVCVTSGMVKVFLEAEDHNDIILRIMKPTDLIGGPGFKTDNRHHFSATAIVDTVACFIELSAFEKLLNNNTVFALEMIAHLNRGHIGLYNRLLTNTHKHMSGRMAGTLLYLAEDIYKSNHFETALSRQDLADISGMTKESAIRVLKEFKDEGVLDCSNHYFTITNPEALRKIYKFG
jgi:CRP/FNR family transcriptional regulator